MFGFGKKKKKGGGDAKPPTDPMALYDELLLALEQRGEQTRRSAATLLVAKSEISDLVDKCREQHAGLRARLARARELGDARAAEVLTADVERARVTLNEAEAQLGTHVDDVELLTSGARELAARLSSLRAERAIARVKLAAGGAVVEALQHEIDEFTRALKLDRARDEVEKARALADVYREEARGKKRSR